MPVLFNESTVESKQTALNANFSYLVDTNITSDNNILLSRIEIPEKSIFELSTREDEINWLLVLDGELSFKNTQLKSKLTDTHLVYLPWNFEDEIQALSHTVVLHAVVPSASRFDPALLNSPPELRIVDWAEEPVLNSEHDARKRIYLVTPKMFGTTAMCGEMIIYPPHTKASNHYHVGAEHFQYVTKGEGLCYFNGEAKRIRAGDVIYNYENEPHYFENDTQEDMVFVEFFVPGEFDTIWLDNEPVCAWLPTGKNIKGGDPVRHIAAHSSEPRNSPQDV